MNKDIKEDGTKSQFLVAYNIMFVGNSLSGKSSIVNRIIKEEVNSNYVPTIGVDYRRVELEYKQTKINVKIFDASGVDRFQNMVESYFKGNQLIFFVFDVSNIDSFNAIQTWIDWVKKHINSDTKLILIGNKIDLAKAVDASKAQDFAKDFKMTYYEVSAITGENVDDMFLTAITELSYFDEFRDQDNDKREEQLKEFIENNKLRLMGKKTAR